MSDAPFMIGANGLILDTSFNGLPQGQATVGLQPNIAPGESPNPGGSTPGPWIVSQLLPGAIVQLVGGGEYDLLSTARSPMLGIGNGSSPQLGGTTGSIQVDLVTSAGGGGVGQPLVYLVAQTGLNSAPVEYVGVFLDPSNRPTFTITDANGVIKAQGSLTTPTYAAGTRLQIRLFWDSTGTVLPSYAALLVNGTAQPLGTVTGPWQGFQPAAVIYGRGMSSVGGSPFAGQLLKVQVSNSPLPTNSQIAPATSQTPP
jgi:hypothetical protein